jgi:hypothetical protein
MRSALAVVILYALGCASAPPAPAPLAPPPPPTTALAPATSVPVPVASTPPPPAPAPTPDPTPVDLVIERPFVAWARGRPEGRVAGASHDQELARWNVGGTGDPAFVSNRPGYHPAPRVKVDTAVVAGALQKKARVDPHTKKPDRVLSQASLLARARKYGYWPFRLCFEAGLRKKQTLGGKTRIRFRVNRAGRILQKRLVHTKLEDREVAQCLVEAAGEIELLPALRSIDVEATIELWRGDAPLPSLIEPPEKPPTFDPEVIAPVVEAARPSFEACYRSALTRDAALWGRIELALQVDAAGVVVDANERDSQFPDAQAVTCVVEAARALAFPPKKARPPFLLAFRLGNAPSMTADP